MAANKGESGSVQAGDVKKDTKKPKATGGAAAPRAKTMTVAERITAEAKAAYKDLDLSEGRQLRKRPAPANDAKKSPAKKTAAKKTAPAKKSAKAADEPKTKKGGKAKEAD